jgi:hypothetical protein
MGMSWEFMEMLVLGKIMDAGLDAEEHKLQGDGYVNFVEWCLPHDEKHPKKKEIAASRDKIVSKLVEDDQVVVVNISSFAMQGHFVSVKGAKKPAGAEGEDKPGDKDASANETGPKKEFKHKVT